MFRSLRIDLLKCSAHAAKGFQEVVTRFGHVTGIACTVVFYNSDL